MLTVALEDKVFKDQATLEKVKFNMFPTNGLEIFAISQLKRPIYMLDKLKQILQKKNGSNEQ